MVCHFTTENRKYPEKLKVLPEKFNEDTLLLTSYRNEICMLLVVTYAVYEISGDCEINSTLRLFCLYFETSGT